MLYLRTFGGLALERDGQPLTGPATQRRRLALLAILAASNGQGVSRDRLLAFLWPDSDVARARGALNQALYSLRRLLGDDSLTIGNTDLQLNAATIRSDVGDFVRDLATGAIAEAVARYEGPFLDGVYLEPELVEFREWTEQQRARRAHEYRGALRQLAETAARRGERRSAVDWWARLAGEEPLNEEVAASYAEALVNAGDLAGALRATEIYTRLVQEELGVPPSARFADRVRRLRHPDAASPVVEQESPAGSPDASVAGSIDGNAPLADERPNIALPPTRRWRAPLRRYWPSLAAATAVLVVSLIGIASAFRTRVVPEVILVLPLENRTGDSSYAAVGRMAADWIMRGLTTAQLAEVLDVRRGPTLADSARGSGVAAASARELGATLLIRGSIYRQRDTLIALTELVRTSDGTVLKRLPPVAAAASSPTRLAEDIRERVMGVLATSSDQRFSGWQDRTAAPPRYDAYQEFLAGLEQMDRDRDDDGFAHFMKAATLDTSFVLAKFFALNTQPDGPTLTATVAFSDSLVQATMAQRDALTPYEQASLDRMLADNRGDYEGVYRASHRMLAIAPHSADAQFFVAQAAVATNRFTEGVVMLDRVEPHRAWLRLATIYDRWHALAYHMAGDYEGELRVTRKFTEGKCLLRVIPLAALGREAEVDSVGAACNPVPGRGGSAIRSFSVAMEYHAHGWRDAERRAFGRAREWYAAQQPKWEEPLSIIAWYEGDWSAVRAYWQSRIWSTAHDTLGTPSLPGLGQLGAAAAHLGDTATATAMFDRLSRVDTRAMHGQAAMWMAVIRAALGQREAAVSLLSRAIDEGLAPLLLHKQPGLDPLRGYGPYEALLRPRPASGELKTDHD